MKFAGERPFANPETAARKLIEIANSVEAVQDGRIHIELVNGPMLYWRPSGRHHGCTTGLSTAATPRVPPAALRRPFQAKK